MSQLLHTRPAGPPLLGGEDYAMKGLDFWGRCAPRRSQTVYNYQPAPLPPDRYPGVHEERSKKDEKAAVAAAAAIQAKADEVQVGCRPQPMAKDTSQTRRPLLPPPRRSYSVMNHEPIPHYHRSSARMTLMDLPAEMHYSIFDFLDPIDSTCLGLTNSHFYSIHRRMHGVVPLSTHRSGPNELEWAWWLANRPSAGTTGSPSVAPALAPTDPSQCRASPTAPASSAPTPTPTPAAAAAAPLTPSSCSPPAVPAKACPSCAMPQPLAKLRVRGQAYCRKCGALRCELHKHIQDWMGSSAEYCSVKQKFGPMAPDGAKAYCYMSRPGDPSRCGRHRRRGSKWAYGEAAVAKEAMRNR